MSLADRILQRLGLPVPEAATSQEWADWHAVVRLRHPVVYSLCVQGPRRLNRLGDRLLDPFRHALNAVRYRVVDRYHVIPTGLDPGYHQIEDRLLHGAFQLLVDHIEVELASIQLRTTEALRAVYRVSVRGVFRRRVRSADAGLAYLAWGAELRYESEEVGEALAMESELTPQAAACREMRELYVWWTLTRPARPEPYAASGYEALCAASDAARGFMCNGVQRDPDASGALDHMHALEQGYAVENTEMLVRLARVRQSL